MAWQYALSDSVGAGIRYDLGTLNSLYVGVGVNVISTNGSTAITGSGNNQVVEIFGAVVGDNGIYWYGTSGTAINIHAGASVYGYNAGIVAGGVVRLVNDGDISGHYYGITIYGNSVTAVNTGSISSDILALEFYSVTNGVGTEAEAINYGEIVSATGYAVNGDTNFGDRFLNYGMVTGNVEQGGGDDLLVNRGQITGEVYIDRSFSGAGTDTVDNRGGRIDGNIYMGGGGDILDNRGGTINGTAFGEDGADYFRPGAGIDVFDGGIGNDTLDFRGSSAIALSLNDSISATGFAADDTYIGFESITGSNFDDRLVGNGAGNVLNGANGADQLGGGNGADTLRGGNGIDELTGGLGNDRFRFGLLSEIGDTITDFHKISGDRDRVEISATNFGGGLAAGALSADQFRSRADNAAQDADDRFIFRTTDRTLWYDDDGNGAGEAVMIAQFQGAVSLAAADIVIF